MKYIYLGIFAHALGNPLSMLGLAAFLAVPSSNLLVGYCGPHMSHPKYDSADRSGQDHRTWSEWTRSHNLTERFVSRAFVG